MKNKIALILAALICVSLVLFSQEACASTNEMWVVTTNYDCPQVSIERVMNILRKQGDIPELVKELIKSGDVCAVVGHQWERRPHMTMEYRPDGEYPEHRQCRLCGKFETREPGEWK